MIRRAQKSDLKQIDELSENTVLDMQKNRLFQWSLSYPRYQHFEADLNQKNLYVYEQKGSIIGTMVFYPENEATYKAVNWLRKKSLVVHRILVAPAYQKQGIASALINYVIKKAHQHNYESIKIDTHPGNTKMRQFLKRHQFVELDYIKSIHRIAFERLIEHGNMHKIMILGSSGTGKTTLAKILSQKLKLPYLALDTVYWKKDWASLSKEAFAQTIRGYLHKHNEYIIEGNYTNSITFMERLKHADTVIMLDYPTKDAIKGILEREQKYRHIYRSDMASGCIENIDQEFLTWVYRFKDKAHKMRAIMYKFKGEKTLLTFTNRSSLMRWIDTL